MRNIFLYITLCLFFICSCAREVKSEGNVMAVENVKCGECAKLHQNVMAVENEKSVKASSIEEYASQTAFLVGKPNDEYAAYFTGRSWLEILNSSGAVVANVTFEPGCRNNWHIHHGEMQILIGVKGRGWLQIEGEEAKPIYEGDVFCIEPGVKHWHGAAKDSWFSHLSISVAKADSSEKRGTNWLDVVDETLYGKLK